LLDYFSPLIQRTKPVPAISQIQSYRNVTALGLLLHRRRAYLSAIAQTLFAFSSNLVRCTNYGRGRGVGRLRGVGAILGVGVGVAVGVAVGVVVAVGVGVGVGVAPACAQYVPPVFK
jgi:hypothetical protein